jgi:hypothetical protein
MSTSGLDKWNADGTIDTTFAYTHDPATPGFGFALEAQADRSLLNAYLSDQAIGWVFRVLPTGAIDTSFAGGAGHAQFVTAETGIQSLFGMRVTSDAIYVLAGANKTPSLTLAKFNIDGSTIANFGDAGTPGQLKTPLRPAGTAAGFDVDSKKRVVMAGVTTVAGVNQLALIRFDALGGPDTSLSSTGLVAFPFGTVSPRAVFVVDDERVLVLGLRDGNGFIARFWM